MSTNSKNPTDVNETGAVELTESELEQASGGGIPIEVLWAATRSTSTPAKPADGSVKPFMAGGLGGDGTGI